MLEFGSLSQSLQSVLKALCWECGFSSPLLPTIALQTTPACECWGLQAESLPSKAQQGSASASEELEAPQEELGVTLPQQEGFLLLEVDNEYLQCREPSCRKGFSSSLWVHLSLLCQCVPQVIALLQDLCVWLGNPFPCGDTL